jgi:hypothetical protein
MSLADFFLWLKQNSIYVVSLVLVVRQVSTSASHLARIRIFDFLPRSLGAVLLLAAPATPSLPADDQLYLKTFETNKVV